MEDAALSPTDRKTPFRHDLTDGCDLPGLVLFRHGRSVVHIPNTPILRLPIGERQGHDRPGRLIKALLRKATVRELLPGRKRLWLRVCLL